MSCMTCYVGLITMGSVGGTGPTCWLAFTYLSCMETDVHQVGLGTDGLTAISQNLCSGFHSLMVRAGAQGILEAGVSTQLWMRSLGPAVQCQPTDGRQHVLRDSGYGARVSELVLACWWVVPAPPVLEPVLTNCGKNQSQGLWLQALGSWELLPTESKGACAEEILKDASPLAHCCRPLLTSLGGVPVPQVAVEFQGVLESRAMSLSNQLSCSASCRTCVRIGQASSKFCINKLEGGL